MIRESSFEQVYEYWSKFLWPNRLSPIEKTSAIDPNGKIDASLLDNPVWFFVFERENNILGVISLHQTDEVTFRSRGLWVGESSRGQGVGRALVCHISDFAQEHGGKSIWTMPRENAIGFYLKNNFHIYAETNEYEFGKHYLAVRKLGES